MSAHPEEIEAHYRKSAFVKEVCVMHGAAAGRPASEPLYAVVVPNMDLMRQRKIVNAGDLLRFELEGLTYLLPPDQRVSAYEIWFEPLPRTSTAAIKREDVERRVQARRQAPLGDTPLTAADQAWLDEPNVAAALPMIQARVKRGTRVRPDWNLELDVGLDSLERVELIGELEQAFAVKLSHAVVSETYTVRQLVDALRAAIAARGPNAVPAAKLDEFWPAVLRELPDLNWLLRKRTFAAPVLWLIGQLINTLFVRVRVSGLEKLPASRPYIICPNHQSLADAFVLCGALPYRVFKEAFFVGAIEYFESRFTQWMARTMNIVPIDPDSYLVPAMQAGAFGLSHGKILMLFPEGERTIDGTVRKFKKGAPILAQHLGVPVVPAALKGMYEVWPRNGSINWALVAPWSGHRVLIEFGEPMTLAATANYHDSAVRLRARVNEMWEALSP